MPPEEKNLPSPHSADTPPASPPPRQAPTALNEILRRLGAVSVLGVLSFLIPIVGLATLLWYARTVTEWLHAHQDTGPLIYIGLFALFSGLAILPTHVQAIAGGWAFGFRIGYPAAMLGLTLGALLAYAIARGASGRRVTELIREYPKLRVVYDALIGRGFWKTLLIVTLVRLPPSAPFAASNVLLAATRVPLPIYLLGTILGLAPRTAVVTFVASGLAKLDFTESKPWGLIIAGVLVSLVALGIIGYIANRALTKMTEDQSAVA